MYSRVLAWLAILSNSDVIKVLMPREIVAGELNAVVSMKAILDVFRLHMARLQNAGQRPASQALYGSFAKMFILMT